MSYYKADYSGNMTKTQCIHDNLLLWKIFPDNQKLISKPQLYEFP